MKFATALLAPLMLAATCWADPPAAPMPDDVRRQEEGGVIEYQASSWLQEGRKLLACQRFDGDVSKVTFCKATKSEYDGGTVFYWLHDDRTGQVCGTLRVGQYIFRDNLCKQPQATDIDPRKIWNRMMESGLLDNEKVTK